MFLIAGIWNTLGEWDRWLFSKINGEWTNAFFDAVMPFLRNPSHWAPLYLFLAALALINFRHRGAWWCIFFLATVALTDLGGNYGFKQVFERVRPCNETGMPVRLLIEHCGVGPSFVSNHAANHFGMAVFFGITFRRIIGKWAWIGLVWAFAISYAQVYVGIHYPFDVTAGALLGILAGSLTGWLFQDRFSLTRPHAPLLS